MRLHFSLDKRPLCGLEAGFSPAFRLRWAHLSCQRSSPFVDIEHGQHGKSPVSVLGEAAITRLGESPEALERESPARTIVVLITDFYEGGSVYDLVSRTKSLLESGAQVLGLAALDAQAKPDYDRETAGKLVKVGAHVGAMTPGQLAAWLAEKIQGGK